MGTRIIGGSTGDKAEKPKSSAEVHVKDKEKESKGGRTRKSVDVKTEGTENNNQDSGTMIGRETENRTEEKEEESPDRPAKTQEERSRGSPTEQTRDIAEGQEVAASKPTFTLYGLVNGRTKWLMKKAPKFKREDEDVQEPPIKVLREVKEFANKVRTE